MGDIRSVLSQFRAKAIKDTDEHQALPDSPRLKASSSEIPDVFFDIILQKYKLSRLEISLLMHLYRQIWCRPNLYKSHGIGPLNSYKDLSGFFNITSDELVNNLRTLENFGLLITVRAGQYFIRKYFTEDLDSLYGQNYDEFF